MSYRLANRSKEEEGQDIVEAGIGPGVAVSGYEALEVEVLEMGYCL